MTAVFLLLAIAPVIAAESPAEQISAFRLEHGEVRVVRDATLDGIARAQARAMAAKDDLSHEVLGRSPGGLLRHMRDVPPRILPTATRVSRRRCASGSGHRKNLLLHNASRVGIASAKDASGKRTYWAMVIAGDYEPKPSKGKSRRDKEPLVAVKRETGTSSRTKSTDCHIKVLGLCI